MRKKSLGGLVAAVAVAASSAFGAGYERSVMWSGKKVGTAGIGSPLGGAESIFFNPAGLGSIEKFESSLNFSPTIIDNKGPIVTANQQVEGKQLFLPVFGAVVGAKVTDQLAVGLGAYVAGGARARFENIDVSPNVQLNPNLISEITAVEYSLGASYEILPRLRIGAAWRILQVNGDIAFFASQPTGVISVEMNKLKQTRADAYRVGIQYEGPGWGAGVTYRSSVDFTLKGTATGNFGAGGAPPGGPIAPLTGGDALAASTLPEQVKIGGYGDVCDGSIRILGEYEFTKYSKLDKITLAGKVGTLDLANAPLRQDWRDQHVYRLGFEYRGFTDTVLRAGYARTSQVTPFRYARPSFASPGTGNSITLGAGHSYFEKKLDFDLAFDYSFASGDVGAGDLVSTNPPSTTPGRYETRAIAAHVGLTYRL